MQPEPQSETTFDLLFVCLRNAFPESSAFETVPTNSLHGQALGVRAWRQTVRVDLLYEHGSMLRTKRLLRRKHAQAHIYFCVGDLLIYSFSSPVTGKSPNFCYHDAPPVPMLETISLLFPQLHCSSGTELVRSSVPTLPCAVISNLVHYASFKKPSIQLINECAPYQSKAFSSLRYSHVGSQQAHHINEICRSPAR